MGQLDKTSRRVSGASYPPRGNKLSQVRRRVSAGDDDKMIDKIALDLDHPPNISLFVLTPAWVI